ncbi:Pectin lyase fold/virulence factor [Penicillium canescens]|nr:Pectin lyase fold/virulence factor [Penicillium canescens]KAJ6081810.1 Pectin lyase fold/virulence factor [Penicillium canescens]KAJ6176390.1 Pectin lyase fold/virulence factor [Penicillium canescens]
MAQASAYTFYDGHYEDVLKLVHQRCGRNVATAVPDPVEDHSEEPNDFYSSDTYTTIAEDTCGTIVVQENISSASLFIGIDEIHDGNDIAADDINTYSASATCGSSNKT